MSNTIVSKVTITKDNANILVSNIREGLRTINKGYLGIAPDVQKLYDTKAFEVLGYKNFDEMCTDLFEMSHGTTVGIRKVFGRFGSKSSKDGLYCIPDKYLDWGYTKLLFFATSKSDFEKANIDPLEVFTPSMTMGEMKLALTTALTDKATEQDKNAIETTAEEVTAEEATAEEATAEEVTAEEATAEEFQNMTLEDWAKNPKAYCDQIISDMNALHGLLENSMKPEKLTILEGAIAYMKEVKKAIKK